MISDGDIKDLKEKHKGGWSALYKTVSMHGRIVCSIQLWLSVILSVILVAFICFFCDNFTIFSTIGIVLDQILSVLPNLLGFTLTGYVLLVGFGNGEYMETITEQNDNGYSYFQHIGSIFAWCCIVQSLTLCISYTSNIIYKANISFPFFDYINILALCFLLFITLYSLLLVVRLVMNVFLFAQTVQFHFVEKRIIAEFDEKSKIIEKQNENQKGLFRLIIEKIWNLK